MISDIDRFIDHFVEEIREGNAAVFAGAGLSAASGFVNWRDLVRPLGEGIGLNVDNEHDLIAVAQYYYNQKGRNRNRINQLLIEGFGTPRQPSDNHNLLAKLPIDTYWTTNYDKLIETALDDEGKVADVKYTVAHLATTTPSRDAIVYKMHGDIDHPNEAVLIKDDYECYERYRGAYITALAGDLVSKTFLFIGFSFSDPNLDYILSKIRINFKENQRSHYCILKRIDRSSCSQDEFNQANVRQILTIEDLQRFNVTTLLVDDYSEVNDILSQIELRHRLRTVFISGSARRFGRWGDASSRRFLSELSYRLVDDGFRIATGFGLGVGDAVISGALECLLEKRARRIDDTLTMRPFPRNMTREQERRRLFSQYRESIIAPCGVAVFFMGNKVNGDDLVVNSEGVRAEFEIARKKNLILVPIGASGYAAEDLWRLMNDRIDNFFPKPSPTLLDLFRQIGERVEDPADLVEPVLSFIKLAVAEAAKRRHVARRSVSAERRR